MKRTPEENLISEALRPAGENSAEPGDLRFETRLQQRKISQATTKGEAETRGQRPKYFRN